VLCVLGLCRCSVGLVSGLLRRPSLLSGSASRVSMF